MNHLEVKRRQIQGFSYMIGLITLVIAGRNIGDYGIVYLAAAVETVTLFLLLICSSVPDSLGRILRNRNAKGQYKSAEKIRKSVLLFQIAAGIACSVLLILLSDIIAQNILNVPYCSLAIKLLAPVLLIRVISGVLEGYFQGSGTQMPTVAVSVLRQVFWLGFGILFANILKGYGEKVSALLQNDLITPMYQVAGLAVGMILTELLLILFLIVIYFGSKRKVQEHTTEGLRMTESFGGCVSSLYLGMSADIVMNLLVKLPVLAGLILFQKGAVDSRLSMAEYGAYYGKYLTACAFPVFLTSIILLPVCARIAANIRREEYRFAKDVFGIGMHISFVYTLFAAVFMAVMAQQLAEAFFTGEITLAVKMIRFGSTQVIFAVLTVYFGRVLILTGSKLLALGTLAVYSVVHIAGIIISMNVLKQGALSLVYGGLAAAIITCILSGVLVCLKLKPKLNLIACLAVPAAACGAVGLLWFLLGKAVTPHLGSLVTLFLCLVSGIIVYWLILLFTRSFRAYELDLLPGGQLLKMLAKIMKAL